MRYKTIAALAVSAGLLFAPVTAQASESDVQVKYDTTFVYRGNNRWTVSPNSAQFALHNIGARQSWLCNSNNVGAGITACVPGTTYETTGEAYADGSGSCVYVQGDSPAWDTVPGDPTKRVCADEPASEPAVPVAPVDPTPEPSTDPTAEPTDPTPTDPTTPVEPDPEPSGSVDPTPDPAESTSAPEPTSAPTNETTPTPAVTTPQNSKQTDTATTANAPAESLATTGSDPKPIALAATVLLIIGAVLVGFAGRRRR